MVVEGRSKINEKPQRKKTFAHQDIGGYFAGTDVLQPAVATVLAAMFDAGSRYSPKH